MIQNIGSAAAMARTSSVSSVSIPNATAARRLSSSGFSRVTHCSSGSPEARRSSTRSARARNQAACRARTAGSSSEAARRSAANWRIDSSIEKRGAPASSPRWMSERSTRLAEDVEIRLADRFGGLQRATAREDTQPPEQRALGVRREVVAPLDGCPQRLLPWVGVAIAFEKVQALRQPLEDLFDRHHRQAGRCQAEGQGEPVEALRQGGECRRRADRTRHARSPGTPEVVRRPAAS